MKFLYLLSFLLTSSFLLGQNSETEYGLNELSQIYQSYSGNKSVEDISVFEKYEKTDLESTARFIQVLTQANNRIYESPYLKLPTNELMRFFNIILLTNIQSQRQTNKNRLSIIKKLLKQDQKQSRRKDYHLEQLRQYYRGVFSSILNKNPKFDLSEESWNSNQLGMKNRREDAVFYYTFIEIMCRPITIFSKKRIKSKWDKIEQYISRLPLIYNRAYYMHYNIKFKDFKCGTEGKKKSFKKHYFPKAINTQFAHFNMLREKAYSKDIQFDFYAYAIISMHKLLQKYSNNTALNSYHFEKVDPKEFKRRKLFFERQASY